MVSAETAEADESLLGSDGAASAGFDEVSLAVLAVLVALPVLVLVLVSVPVLPVLALLDELSEPPGEGTSYGAAGLASEELDDEPLLDEPDLALAALPADFADLPAAFLPFAASVVLGRRGFVANSAATTSHGRERAQPEAGFMASYPTRKAPAKSRAA